MTSDLYNVFSKNNIKIIKRIASLGHEIGIHFDETCYSRNDDLAWAIQKEARILGEAIEQDVKTVSMHRPSKGLLDENIQIDGIINSYSDVFFKEFKYLSDSRRRWREPVEEIINTGAYNRLHILTHAFWYNEIEIDLYESVFGFIRSAQQERY